MKIMRKRSLDDTRETHCPKMSSSKVVYAYGAPSIESNHQESGPSTDSHSRRHQKGNENYMHIVNSNKAKSEQLILSKTYPSTWP
jgi:hypothetical protein